MEILLQHRITKLFVSASEDWSTSSRAALVFRNSLDAARHAAQERLTRDVRMVVRFTQPPHHILLPLGLGQPIQRQASV